MDYCWLTKCLVLLTLVACIFGERRTPFRSPPHITSPNSTSITVDVGEDVKFICSGSEPLSWTNQIRAIITPNNYGGIFESTLLLKKVTVNDVSDYCCNYGEMSEYDPCIYLFVKDIHNPLVVGETMIRVPPDIPTNIFIECKGSWPEIRPTIQSEDEMLEQIPPDYDPEKGFTYYNQMFPGKVENFQIECYYGDKSHTFEVGIDSSEPVNLDEPITLTGPYHAELGKELILNCSYPYANKIKWTYPNSIKKGHVREEGRWLIIDKVTYDDSGNYSCYSGKNFHNASVKVVGKNDSYINIDAIQTEYSLEKKEKLKIVIYVTSYPEAILTWYFWPCTTSDDSKCQEPIDLKDKERYKISVTPLHDKVRMKLEINSVTENDSGPYKLRARNDNNTKEVNFTVNVEAEPDLYFDGIKDSYNENETTQITCIIRGYPKPKENQIFWYFLQTLDESDVTDDCKSLKLLNPVKIDPNEYKYIETFRANNLTKLTSSINYTVHDTGYMISYANNSIGEGCTIQRLLVTEGDPEIISNPKELVENDMVTFTCRIPKYNFTNDIRWYYNGKELNEEVPTREETKFSYMSKLSFPKIKKNHSGIYECEFPLKNNEYPPEKIELNVTVLKEMKPKIYSTNMNQTEIIIKKGVEFNFTCMPYGFPKPNIVWFKDGSEIKHDNHYNITENKTFLKVSYATVDDEGEYTCRASNRVGQSERKLKLTIKDKINFVPGVVVGVVIIIGLVLLAIYLCYRIWKEKKLRKQLTLAGLYHFEEGAVDSLNRDLPVDEQAELLPYDKLWEFPREKLRLGKQLGAGAFGIVVKAEAKGILEEDEKTTVAVKMVKRNADTTYIKALASELKIMVHLGKHLNVVNLLGACTRNVNKMELLVIVEYCRFGNLHNYLMRHRESFINQLDPATQEINPNAPFATIPEETMESSVSKLKYASLDWNADYEVPISPKPDTACANDYREMNSNSANSSQNGSQPPASPSGEIVTSDMSLISMSPTGGEDNTMVLSNNSTSEQPRWRSNYRGDYKPNLSNPVCTRDLLCWAFQVARGMEYLCSRKVLHGDLAARNILLAENNIVKICDFGLAKSMYKSDNYKKKGQSPLPVKWMAIESIRDGVFSSQSDVWSYGIVLWEFFSLAKTPYPGMLPDETLYNKLVEGYRMERPEYSPNSVYSIMQLCWQTKPSTRPSFSDLAEQLGSMLENSVRQHYVDLNGPYICMNSQRIEEGKNDYLAMLTSPDYRVLMSPPEEETNNLYVNSPRAEPSENEGYLQMKGSGTIFSPRPVNSEIPKAFDFNPTKLRSIEAEGADGVELQPILSSPPGVVNNPSYKYMKPNQHPTTNAENYINMPGHSQNKKPMDKTIPSLPKSVSNPHYMTEVTFQKQNDKEPEAYLNLSKGDDTIHI